MRAFPANIIFETSKCRRTMSLIIIIGVRYIENKCDERKKKKGRVGGGGGGEKWTPRKKEKTKTEKQERYSSEEFCMMSAYILLCGIYKAFITQPAHNLVSK